MRLSTKLNFLSAVLFGSLLLILTYTLSTFSYLSFTINEMQSFHNYLDEIKTCNEILLRQLSEGQRILISNSQSVSGELLVSIRLLKSQLNKSISEIEKMSPDINSFTGKEISQDLLNLYNEIDGELIKKIFNNESFNSSNVSERLMHKYYELQQIIKNGACK